MRFFKGMTPWNKGKHTGITPWKGKKRDAHTLEKLRLSALGRKKTPEEIERTRQKNIGKKRTPEQCENIARSLRGKKFTEERRKRLSETHKRLGTKAPDNTGRKQSLAERNMHRLYAKRGSECNFWKGGVTPLHFAIRYSFENDTWRKSCFIRDGYKCKCGEKAKGVHHIIPFYKLFADFLKQYSQFSPIEDKETLIRLAVSYAPFWDINNGISICRECHIKTDSYKRPVKLAYAGTFL